MKYARILCLLIASTLTACTTYSLSPSEAGRKLLIKVACPDLDDQLNKDFGSVDLKLIEVAGQYYKCQAAALGEQSNGDRTP